MNSVAFTGYRPGKLPFYEDETDLKYMAFRVAMRKVINRLIERGYINFISGIAIGFDTWAAEDIIEIKKQNKKIKLECAIPFPGQDHSWSQKDKDRRKYIIKQSDKVTTVSKHYQNRSYFIRNEYMVDNADVIVCCYDGQEGGTAYTVNYAKKKNKIIIQINPSTSKVTIISDKGFD